MTWKTGKWGKEEKERSKNRTIYFREYRRKHPQKQLNGCDERTEEPKTTDSIGAYGEKIALKYLKGSKWNGTKYDINWLDKKVDVKTALPTFQNNYPRWKFFLKQKGNVDLFILFCLDQDRTIQRVYVIPDENIDVKNITIMVSSEKTKYSKYQMPLL